MFNIHRKTPVLEPLFNEAAGQKVFSREICKIFKNTFFHRTSLVAASVIFKQMTLSFSIQKLSECFVQIQFLEKYVHFYQIFFTGPNTIESSSKLLKQFPVKFAVGMQLYLKETPMFPVIFGKFFRTSVLKNTLAHQLLKLFHSSFFSSEQF